MPEKQTIDTIRLMKAAKEFNIGKDTLVDFLTKSGFTVANNPNAILTAEMYLALLGEYASDKKLKRSSDQIILRSENIILGDQNKTRIKKLEEHLEIQIPLVENFENKDILSCYRLNRAGLVVSLKIRNQKIQNITFLSDFMELEELDLCFNSIDNISILKYLKQLKILKLGDNQITDLNPLSTQVNLSTLNLYNNKIIDISPLGHLHNLTEVYLSRNLVSDLKPLESLIKLTRIYLGGNAIKDISTLASISNLEELYLDVNQIEDINAIASLKNLQELNLNKNQIRDLSPLATLSGLRTLYLENNLISDLSPLTSLKALQTISLDDNQITDLSPLIPLSGLQILKLAHNKFTDLSPLIVLKGLKKLDLSQNQITNLSSLAKLSRLQELGLSYNLIENLGPLASLRALQVLYLSNNQIRDLSPLARLSALQKLILSFNQIIDFSPLASLSGLQELYLYKNLITDLKPLASLELLQKLDITNNLITDLTPLIPLLQKRTLKYLDIKHNPIINPPYEIVQQGKEAILNYFSKREEKLVKYTLPAKVLLLGNDSTGKSNLLNYIINTELIDKSDSTHIIHIEEYPNKIKKDTLPEAVFFDFGGQDYYHGMYKAFLSNNAISLLLWNTQSNRNSIRMDSNGVQTQDFTINYWIHQLHYSFHLKDSNTYIELDAETVNKEPVLMIQSYADKEEQAGYSSWAQELGVQNQFYISLNKESVIQGNKYEAGLQYLRACLLDLISSHKKTIEEPEWYNGFINYIYQTKNGNEATPLTEIEKHYKRKGKDKHHLPAELEDLHRQGLILFYRGMEVAWLEPEALIAHIHKTILYQGREFEKGKEGIVNKVNFETDVIDTNILKLLINQKVIFLHQNKEYIIPNYLPLANKGDADYDLLTFGYTQPNFILKFLNFIPFGLINQIICHFGETAKRFWRDQIVFNHEGLCNVLIKIDFSNLEILVYLSRLENIKERAAIEKDLFYEILYLYWDMHILFEKLKNTKFLDFKSKKQKNFVERIREASIANDKFYDSLKSPNDLYISIDNENFIHHSTLESTTGIAFLSSYTFAENSNRILHLQKSKEIPAFQFQAFTNNKTIKKVKKIFISYSNEDVHYKQELEKYLKLYETFNIAKAWSCEEITPGLWHQQIQSELESSDVIIFMLSINFVNSSYIVDEEVIKSLKNVKGNSDKKIVCVLVKNFPWQSFSKLQGITGIEIADIEQMTKPQALTEIANYQFLPYYTKNQSEENARRFIQALNKWEFPEDAYTQIIEKINTIL